MAKEVKIILSADSTGVNGPLDQAAASLEKFGKKAEHIGRDMEGLGTRIAGLGGAVQAGLGQVGLDLPTISRAAVDAEKSLFGIAITAGLAGDKARAAVGDWSIAINQIAVQTNQAQAEVITAFNDLVAKGISDQDALRMLAPIGKAATAAGADIKDIASAANAAFQNLGVGPEKLTQALDIMAQAGNSGGFELRHMAQYFDALTVKSSMLGAEGPKALSQIAAAAQIARQGAGDASTAANNLANFLDKLSAPATAKNFEKFGINLGEEVKKGLASGDLIGYMGELVLQVSGGDAAKVSALFTDVQAKAFIAPLIQNLEEYKRIRDEAFGASGVIDQDFQTAMQSMSATFDQFKIAGQSAMGSSDAVKGLLGTLKDLAAWAAEHPDIVAMIGIGSAAAVVGGGVIAGVGAVLTAIGTISTALAGLHAFLVANPVVLAVLGVAAVGAATYALGNWLGLDEAGRKLGGFIFDIQQKLSELPEWAAGKMEEWKQAGARLIQAMREGISGALKGALGIGDKLAEAIAYLKNEGGKWVQVGRDIIQGLLDGIQQKYKEVVAKLKALGKDMLDSIKDVLGIKSPSRAFMAIGRNIGAGLVIGIAASEDEVRKAVEGLGEAALYAGDESTLAMIREQEQAILELSRAVDTLTIAKAKAANVRDWSGRFLPADEAERATAEWQRASDDINRSLTDALFRAFEDGKGFAETLKGTLINTFKTMVLQPTVRAIVAPVGTALASVFAPSALASAAGGAAGGSAMNLASLASGVANAFAPGAISYGIGNAAIGISSALGASSGVATGIGSFVASSVPVIGALAAVASLFGDDAPKVWYKTVASDPTQLEDNRKDGAYAQSSFGYIGLHDSSKNVNAQKYRETFEAIAKLDETIAASLMPEKIAEIRAELDQFVSAKNESAPSYIKKRLQVITETIDDTLGQIVEHWTGTFEDLAETIPALVALHEYAGRDAMGAVAEQMAKAGTSLMQQWQDQGQSMRALLASYDGGIEATRELAALSQSRYQIELQLAQLIHASLASTQAMFATTIEEMRFSVLDQAGQYEFLRTKSGELEDALKSAIDPATIDSLATQLNDTAKRAWQLLGEEERKIKLAEYEAYLNEIDAMTTERLNAVGATITADKNAELPASISAAIEAAMSRVADQMMAAAQAQMAAAQTPQQVNVDVNVNVDTPSSVEVGVLGGG